MKRLCALALMITFIFISRVIANAQVEVINISLDLPYAWSMISLPVEPADASINTLFPGEGVRVYEYVSGSQIIPYYRQLQADEELKRGNGYWIFTPEERTYTITGTPIGESTIKMIRIPFFSSCRNLSQKREEVNIYRYILNFSSQEAYTNEEVDRKIKERA